MADTPKSPSADPEDEPGRLPLQTPQGKGTSKDEKNTTPDTVEGTPEMEEGRGGPHKPSMTPLKSDLGGRFDEQDSSPVGSVDGGDTKGWCTKPSLLKLAAVLVLAIAALVLILLLVQGGDSSSSSESNLPDDPVAPVDPSVPTRSPTANPTKIPTTPPVNYPTPKPTPFPTRSPTESPTASPTFSPTTNVAGDLRVVLSEVGVEVDSPGSPSGLALGWLAEEAVADASGSEAVTEAYRADPDRLVQRLAILALDFGLQFDADAGSTEVDAGSTGGNFLGIPTIDDTDGDADDADDTTGGAAFLDPGNFFLDPIGGGNRRRAQEEPLVPTFGLFGVDECQWRGVFCNETTGVVTEIRMGNLGLPGRIPTEVGLLGSLSHLDFAMNDLKGSIPEAIFRMSSLQELYLYQNQLTGTLGNEASFHWNQLTQLHVSHNKLSGSIPPGWRSGDEIRNFRYINLSNNQLTGEIPRNLRWRRLFFLDLGHNQLTGTLPVDLGERFVQLKHLHLDHNEFVGTLPESYINVGNGRLEQLTINNNLLTGEVPDNHDLTNKLVAFNLQNNLFDVPLGGGTCKLAVFVAGENVDFKADCDICDCGSFFCETC